MQFEEQPLVLASRNQPREEDEIERAQKLAKTVTSFPILTFTQVRSLDEVSKELEV
jgi:hypothetical protein